MILSVCLKLAYLTYDAKIIEAWQKIYLAYVQLISSDERLCSQFFDTMLPAYLRVGRVGRYLGINGTYRYLGAVPFVGR